MGAASALFERYRPVRHWMTRYFKSLDQEEVSVSVHPETGKVMGFPHTIPEDRPGADIPADRARQIATAFAAAKAWTWPPWSLKESRIGEEESAGRLHAGVGSARRRRPQPG